MAVTLTKEDGTNVEGANTYAALTDLADFLAQRGYSALAADPDAASAALIRAMDVLTDMSPNYVGEPAYVGQLLDWPRIGVADASASSTELPSTYMPPQLLQAQCAAAMYILQGADALPVGSVQGFVTSDKVGPLQTDYAMIPGASTSRPKLPLVDAYLKGITRLYGNALLVGRA